MGVDGLAHRGHQVFFAAERAWGDGGGYDYLDGSWPQSHGLPGLDEARAADAHRHNGLPRLQGHNEYPFFKGQEFPRRGPGAFGKDHHRHAAFDYVCSLVEALDGGAQVFPVYGDGAHPRKRLTEHGYMEERFFGNPEKPARQDRDQCKDVEV